MRLERQPSAQLRESLNVCWEGWRARESERREMARGDERVDGSQVAGGSRCWRGLSQRGGQRERRGRWISVHKTAASDEENRKRRTEGEEGERLSSASTPQTELKCV